MSSEEKDPPPYAITCGRGRKNPKGQSVALPLDSAEVLVAVAALARAIEEHVGVDAWWSPCVFAGGHRLQKNFEGAAAVAIDIDHRDEAWKKSAPPGGGLDMLASVDPAPNLVHYTPHGLRGIWVLSESATGCERWIRAARGVAGRVAVVLAGYMCGEGQAGYEIDPHVAAPTGANAAAFLWAPRASVDGEVRASEVRVISGWTYTIEELEALCPKDAKPEVVEVAPASEVLRAAVSDSEIAPKGWNLAQARKRATAYLARVPGAVSGNNGHDQTWDAALAIVRGFALPADVAMDLLRNYSARCDPPWEDPELEHKVSDARSKAHVPFGYLYERGRDASGTAGAHLPPTTPKTTDTTGERVDVETGEVIGPEWPTLAPLDVVTVPPPFPVESLPRWLADWVAAISHETQTPPDLAGTLALAVLAGGVAGKYKVKPTARARWREPLNLYVAAVMPSGSRKTRVLSEALRPVQEAEADLIAREAPRIAREEGARKILEKRVATAQADAAKSPPETRLAKEQEAGDLAQQLAETPIPTYPQYLAGDVTAEALIGLLAAHDGRMVMSKAEGGGLFDQIIGRYDSSGRKGGSDRSESYLMAHAGDEIKVDRKTSAPVHCAHPALTIITTVQPTIVRALAEQKVLRGQGLFARFLWSWPTDLAGTREVRTDAASQEVLDAYSQEVRRLYDLPVKTDEKGQIVAEVISFTQEADDVLAAAAKSWEHEIGRTGELRWISDWVAKLEGAVARMAGGIHVALGGDHREPIEVHVVEAALALGRYYLAHAQLVFSDMASAGLEPARAVWGWARTRPRFTAAEAWRGLRNNGLFEGPEDLRPALERLEDLGYVRETDRGEKVGPGRRPTPTYEVRPDLVDLVDTRKLGRPEAEGNLVD